jgi:hypothetical protein
VTTWPARWISTRSSSNSLLASVTSSPSTITCRAARSIFTPLTSIVPGAWRRSSARIRASSSASRNGFAT